jgi:glycosyltransferase involved in cell wall biosynthesis
MPSISVLLPVRDAGPWLAPSLASLWRQTLPDFEVVAVDDGSTDGSGEALERAARREGRLRVLHIPASGLPAALNLALGHARGRFIARHDADDLSHRRRFELQRAHLLTHPRVGVLGSRVRIFPSGAAWVGMRRWAAWNNTLLGHEAMAREVLVDGPLVHATAMIRRGALERVGGWEERGWPEDVDLWLRLLAAGIRFEKLPATLYAWRQHAGSATRRQERYTQARFDALRVHGLRRGLLARARGASLVGVGRGLRRWNERLTAEGWRVLRIAAGRPTPALLAELAPPAVLVFGAPPARDRWREALLARGWEEGSAFVFVV